jgi:hypothetical protein
MLDNIQYTALVPAYMGQEHIFLNSYKLTCAPKLISPKKAESLNF